MHVLTRSQPSGKPNNMNGFREGTDCNRSPTFAIRRGDNVGRDVGMARPIHRLTDRRVRTAPLGMHADGGGLYLQCTPGANGNVSRSWLFRFARGGRERQMGLGSLADKTLAEARQDAAEQRQLRLMGVDPIEARRARRDAIAVSQVKAMTFDECRVQYISAHASGWRNVKHAAQWTNTLATYVTPVFGKLPVQHIDTSMVMKALEPIWGSSQKQPPGFAAASKPCSTGPRSATIDKATIQRDGAGISTSCCRLARKFALLNTTLPCPMSRFRTLSRPYAGEMASLPGP